MQEQEPNGTQPEQPPAPPEVPRPRQRKPRRKRPGGRWTSPASPLQAERFRRQLGGLQVIKAIRQVCPGHAGKPCRIDVAKLSDYETGARRPGIEHIEAFCRFYQRSPEHLGLIKWRDDETTSTDEAATPSHDRAGGTDEPAQIQDAVTEWSQDDLAARLLAGLTGGRDLPRLRGGDAPVEELLVHLVSDALALAVTATHLLRTSVEGQSLSDQADDLTGGGAIL